MNTLRQSIAEYLAFAEIRLKKEPTAAKKAPARKTAAKKAPAKKKATKRR